MQKDLIKELCLTQDLIDISGIGTASQSSTSKWSKEDDAQRALSNNNFANFAFHTEKEKNPWWQVEFEKPVNPEYVVINNRKQEPFDEIASELSVIAYDDEDNKKILHLGTVYFGSEDRGCPLIIPMKGKVSLKKLRITLLKENYLHLSNIRFLIADPLKSFGDKPVFFANRRDGLGERLRALLNAMVLAQYTQGSFYFAWSKSSSYKDILDAGTLFSESFVENHKLEVDKVAQLNLKPIAKTKILNNTDENGYLAQRNDNIKKLLKNSGYTLDPQDYKKAFDNIGFSENILSVINYARSLKLNDKVVAIHLRAGDVVYGRIRYVHGFTEKVIPLYVLESLIVTFKKEGYQVLIFGQDNSLCEYLKNEFEVTYSLDLIERPYSQMEEAIYDIVLMSRCQKILAGSSGFAIVSSWIGGIELESYQNYITDEEAMDAFNVAIAPDGVLNSNKVHPLLRSFALVFHTLSYEEHIGIDEKVNILEYALKLDPNNIYSKMLLALALYEKGSFIEANRLIYNELISKNDFSFSWAFQVIHTRDIWYDNSIRILQGYIQAFKAIGIQGSLVALIVVAIYEKKYNDSFHKTEYEAALERFDCNKLGHSLLMKTINYKL